MAVKHIMTVRVQFGCNDVFYQDVIAESAEAAFDRAAEIIRGDGRLREVNMNQFKTQCETGDETDLTGVQCPTF